jgi:hypothetical protein
LRNDRWLSAPFCAAILFLRAILPFRGYFVPHMKDQTLSFTTEDPWRIFRFMAELVLPRLRHAVTRDIDQATDIILESLQRVGPPLRVANALA